MTRRTAVPFDPYYFEREATAGRRFEPAEAFRLIYAANLWGATERSGAGAAIDQAATVLAGLEALIEQLHVRTLLDVPCGDFAWMQHLRPPGNLMKYIGGDVLPELVAENQQRWSSASRSFVTIDLIGDDLPTADLLLCRDCLVHLSLADVRAALRNIRRSECDWLLTTTFPQCTVNEDIVTGDWRPINLQLAPFEFPAPTLLLNERCTEAGGAFADKSLGLWRREDIPECR